jgi:hypothetical protein
MLLHMNVLISTANAAANTAEPTSWLPSIVTGVITGSIALLGVVIVQAWTQMRDKSARKHEQRTWARGQRRAAHAAFLEEQRRLDQWMIEVTRIGGDDVEQPKEGWYHSLSAKLVDVQVFGSPDAAIAARRLYAATIDLEQGTVGAMQRVDELAETYRRWVQRDLGIADSALPQYGTDDDEPWAKRGRI